jgi:hypothetical protein
MRQIARVFAAILPLVAGCQQLTGSASTGETEAVAQPPIKVDLPPSPNFAASDIPEKYPDGVYTVRGLRRNKANTCDKTTSPNQPPPADCLMNKEVKMRGYLLEVYQCPTCPKGQNCKLCDQPHFFLADKPDMKKEKSLMVVDYLLPKQKPPALTVGKQYDVEGSFAVNSPTGFGSSEGLLVFGKMKDDKGQEFLSAAVQLEQKALKGEALEQAALKKHQK